MTSRDIPDDPAGDYRFMAVVMIDGHGKPRKLEQEHRKCLERLLWEEYGDLATLTLLKRTDDSQAITEATLLADDLMGLVDNPDIDLVEE